MKKIINLTVIAALALGTSSAFATNGDNLIGLAVESRAMGSVGIAKSFGAGSGLANAALLSAVKDSEITGTITFFMPNVKATSNAFGQTGTVTDSDADFSAIPEVYYASRINENIVFGIVVAGTAGMGTDYDDAPQANINKMTTNLMLMKIAVPLSYEMGALSLGITPILQYGELALSHTAPPGPKQNNESSDTGFGVELGFAYNLLPSLTIGGIYKSEIAMEYKNVMSKSIASFGQSANITSGDKLTQPQEYGIGLSYTNGANTIAIDYRYIDWGNADGYKDFGWVSQNVIAIGYEYNLGTWALRAGYNHADSPIEEQAETGNGAGSSKNFFNLAGFPGIVESHYTAGIGYKYSDSLSYDVALIYASEKKDSFTTAAFGPGSTVDVSHSQLGITLGATYKF